MLLKYFAFQIFYQILMFDPVWCQGHHDFIVVMEQNFCRTPQNAIGTCVSLKFCPEVLTIYQNLPRNKATQYSMALKRICGNRVTPDQYPVVCCTNAITEAVEPTPTVATTTTTSPTDASEKMEVQNEKSCFTKDLKTGTCRPLENCPLLFDELKRDPTNELFKADLRASHSICGGMTTVVCCPPAETQIRVQPTNNPIHELPTEEEGCGLVNVTLSKIVGGEVSQIGAWPWMVLIGYNPYSSRPFRCGGSLVSARHVITAAHCIVHDMSFVRLGEFDLSIESETRYVDINIMKHAKHHEHGKNRHSDIAVLLLEQSVQFTELIAPICMPDSAQLRNRNYIGSMPYVAGWGNTMQGGSPSHVLKEAQLPIQENEVCLRYFSQLAPSIPASDFGDNIFCVGNINGGTDSCQGDSGGPLMIPELYKGVTRYYLIGVVSYGHGCGKVPSIYTSVQKKMDWVKEKIREM